MIGIVLFGALALFLLLGVPVGVSVGAATMTTIFVCFDLPVSVVAQRLFAALDSVSIMAIPFFVLAGNLMTEGGISSRLVQLANRIVGGVRGGLCYAAILACAFFASLSGSGPATVLAIGSMMYPDMVKLGYPAPRSAGLLAVAGGLGPVIPPSIIMVVYCTITNTSISDMFTAGLYVGLFIVLTLCLLCAYLARKENWPKSNQTFSLSALGVSFFKALPAIFLPVIVLGGIYSGRLTPTESAAVAAIYAVMVGLFIYRELHPKNIIRIILQSAKSSAMILFVIATAASFSWLFTYSGISNELVAAIKSLNLSMTAFSVLIFFILLLFGTFMEGIAMCVLLVPVLFPVAKGLDISGLQFGVIVCVCGVLGAMTPPVAVNIFAAASVSKLKLGEICVGELPFFITFVLTLFLFVLFPQILEFLV